VWYDAVRHHSITFFGLTRRTVVSQFTLLAKTSKGSKPDFHGALGGEEAKRLYHYFLQKVKDGYQAERVMDGRFQAMMQVALVNDGPVSFAKLGFVIVQGLTPYIGDPGDHNGS
jgi:hypothetical protein